MHVVHLIYSFHIGGTESMLLDIMRHQEAMGADVTLVIINNDFNQQLLDTIDPRVRVVKFNRSPGCKNPLQILHLNYLIRRLKPDVIHTHNERGPIAIIGHPCPLGITLHTTGLSPAGNINRIWAISQYVASDFFARCQRQSTVVVNGIDFNNIAKVPAPRVLAPGSPLRLVQVSRLSMEQKGHDLLIKAVALARSRYGIDIEVDFIGDGADRAKLQSAIAAAGLSNSLHLLGNRDRAWIYSHLKNYHALVQPSRIEGFGLTIAEGMGAGIPVLTSDIEGPASIIDGGRLGLIFPSGDISALCETLAMLVKNYQRQAVLAYREAYNYARTNFNIATTARRYLEEYQSLIATELR